MICKTIFCSEFHDIPDKASRKTRRRRRRTQAIAKHYAFRANERVRPFPSAKTEGMQHYLKPTKRDFDPNIFILHVGTNNLSTNDLPEMIADKIVETTESLKTQDNNVVLSAIVPRGDKLNEKAEKVNKLLEKACNQNKICLIKDSNINTKRHLYRRRLHLNGYRKSIFIFIRNIRNYLTNFT